MCAQCQLRQLPREDAKQVLDRFQAGSLEEHVKACDGSWSVEWSQKRWNRQCSTRQIRLTSDMVEPARGHSRCVVIHESSSSALVRDQRSVLRILGDAEIVFVSLLYSLGLSWKVDVAWGGFSSLGSLTVFSAWSSA